MPFVSYRLLVLFGKSFVIFHIIGIIIIDIVCYYQNKAARAQPQTLPPQHQLQMLTYFFLIWRWRGLSCFLGVSVGAPWKWDKACRRQRVDHFRGTLHWHTGTLPPEPTPRFPSCSQTCARATSPQPLCDPFRARQVFVCCVWNFANVFFESIPTQGFAFAILVSAELVLNQNVTSFSALILTIDRRLDSTWKF